MFYLAKTWKLSQSSINDISKIKFYIAIVQFDCSKHYVGLNSSIRFTPDGMKVYGSFAIYVSESGTKLLPLLSLHFYHPFLDSLLWDKSSVPADLFPLIVASLTSFISIFCFVFFSLSLPFFICLLSFLPEFLYWCPSPYFDNYLCDGTCCQYAAGENLIFSSWVVQSLGTISHLCYLCIKSGWLNQFVKRNPKHAENAKLQVTLNVGCNEA